MRRHSNRGLVRLTRSTHQESNANLEGGQRVAGACHPSRWCWLWIVTLQMEAIMSNYWAGEWRSSCQGRGQHTHSQNTCAHTYTLTLMQQQLQRQQVTTDSGVDSLGAQSSFPLSKTCHTGAARGRHKHLHLNMQLKQQQKKYFDVK